jgi:hypothetical protein
MKAPKDGFSSAQITELFSRPKASTSSGSTPSSASSSAKPSASASKKSNGGAIAGGVIGALLGVGAVACGVLFFLRRRKQTAVALSVAADSEMQRDSMEKENDFPELPAVPPKDAVVVQYHELDSTEKGVELEGKNVTALPVHPAEQENLSHSPPPE